VLIVFVFSLLIRGMGFFDVNGSCLEHKGLALTGTATGTGAAGTETGAETEPQPDDGARSSTGGLPNTDSYKGYT
jgi:hypothetical protein